MTMMPFHVLFPEEARTECRTVTPINQAALPNRTFLFRELYCVEPRCDCRRVIFHVFDAEARRHVASINHAFEPPEPPFEDEGQTFLDPINPQSELSDALLGLFEDRDRHLPRGGGPGDSHGTNPGPSWDQAQVLESASVSRSIQGLMAPSGRTKRTKFRDQVLRPLIDTGLLELTIPDKRTSPQQRYRATAIGQALLKQNDE